MIPTDRPQLLHALAVALTTARHVLDRGDRQSIAEAKEQLDAALRALEQLRLLEAAEGN